MTGHFFGVFRALHGGTGVLTIHKPRVGNGANLLPYEYVRWVGCKKIEAEDAVLNQLSEMLEQLSTRGYWVTRVSSCFGSHDLQALACKLGTPKLAASGTGVVDCLVSKTESDAKPNTLSSRFGIGSFPFHTDDAVSYVPAKYLLLHNRTNGELAPTTLVDGLAVTDLLPPEAKSELQEAIFYLSNGRHSYTTTLVNSEHGFLRYNESIMTPASKRARGIWTVMLNQLQDALTVRIRWAEPMLLVIDNHRMLHGRDRVQPHKGERILQRVLVRRDS